MIMREVRCCCDGRLLGWLPERGDEGEVVRFELHSYCPSYLAPDAPVGVEVLGIELEVARFSDLPYPPEGDYILAFKSRDYPIEVLRRLPGWVEVEEKVS